MQHTRPDVLYMLEHAQHLTSTHVFTLRPGRARGGLPTHLPAESSRAGPCQGVSRLARDLSSYTLRKPYV